MPDPRLGVFETLLVLDGRPVELDAHLERLQASLAALYSNLTPPRVDVPSLVGSYEPTSDGTSALRVLVAPGAGGGLSATVEHRPASGHFATENGGKVTTGAISLRSLDLAGGLGAHKWADRSLLDAAQAQLPANALPLIVSGDEVLEASRANVFAVRDEVLVTPPLDGRILPGVTRMRTLELADSLGIDAREEAVRSQDLLAADEVFLTSSVRGVELVAALDRRPLAGAGEVAKRLAAELRRAWTGLKTAAPFG